MDRDPHVHYTTVSRGPGGPETPPAPQTFLSVTLVRDGQEVRFDASARYPGALDDLGSRPHLVFTGDEDGQRALEAVQRVMREGGRATIDSGMGTVLDVIPVGLRGLFPEEGLWGAAELIADEREIVTAPSVAEPDDPMAGPVLLRAGETELGMVLTRTEPPEGWEHAIHGSTGGLTLQMLARRARQPQKVDLRPDWRLTAGEGSGREQLLAVQLMLAMLDGAPLELLRPDGSFLARGVMEHVEDATSWRETLRERETFLRYVTEVEAWLGRELFPSAAPTENDAKALAATVALIRQPESSITWTRAEMAPGAQRPDGDGPWQFAVLQPLWADLFGERIYVGRELLVLPEARIEASADGLAIVPVGETGSGTSRLHRPDEVPPEAANSPHGPAAAAGPDPRTGTGTGPDPGARTGTDAATQQVAPVGRNDPCPCGSGRKYKKCHGR